ncbi:hypothetical protein MMC25_005701 [Agyrium rufum]|nr:hypothetical protein [Agyrium rufum]
MKRWRVLFIDAYDSFSNNLISFLESDLCLDVTRVFIDDPIDDFPTYAKAFAAIVAGPGPGHPANTRDIGLISHVWQLEDYHVVPALGICLGFQSLVLHHGGCVDPLPIPRHGTETQITTNGRSIFQHTTTISSVQYHSLHASLNGSSHDIDDSSDDQDNSLWKIQTKCPELEPLAWDLSSANDIQYASNPKRILMAVKHITKPFYGIQFHPESICSSNLAKQVLREWWREVLEWHCMPHTTPLRSKDDLNLNLRDRKVSCKTKSLDFEAVEEMTLPAPEDTNSDGLGTPLSSCSSSDSPPNFYPRSRQLLHEVILQRDLTLPQLRDLIKSDGEDVIVLDSEMRPNEEVATCSILAIIPKEATRYDYITGQNSVRITHGSNLRTLDIEGGIFQFLKSVLSENKIDEGHLESPFWGGLMGFVTYEAGLETIGVRLSEPREERPDVSFAFVERSIIIDHFRKLIYVQSIKHDDFQWIRWTCKEIRERSVQSSGIEVGPFEPPLLGLRTTSLPKITEDQFPSPHSISLPKEEDYRHKISACKQLISAGESYELCLTSQASATTSKGSQEEDWQRYLRLRQLNPAPFAAFIRLGTMTLLSTSPERFMSWSRPEATEGGLLASNCQLRPIKGTVKKVRCSQNGTEETVSLREATALLSSPKERAENLMIVDLIRHDLHGAIGVGKVVVKKLMAVEEYETVYQLVSVIEGEMLTNPTDRLSDRQSVCGIDVLAASLPPGSMTGAPKRRSCQWLQSIEGNKPRSVYSGVVGYMCVGGGGDFSVVIRSVFKWEDSLKSEDTWYIGAGGAITTLSTEEAEWDEMQTKMRSTMSLFAHAEDLTNGHENLA